MSDIKKLELLIEKLLYKIEDIEEEINYIKSNYSCCCCCCENISYKLINELTNDVEEIKDEMWRMKNN